MLHIIVAVVGLIIGYVCGAWIDNFINRKQKRNLNKINVVSIPAYIKATCPHCDAHIEKNFLDFCHEYSANKSAYYTITCPDCGYILQLSERDVDDLNVNMEVIDFSED